MNNSYRLSAYSRIAITYNINNLSAINLIEEDSPRYAEAMKAIILKSEKGIEFYIRSGNSTRSLNIQEFHDYFINQTKKST
ncbi:MAG: hypothetical protein WCP16_09880 [Pseudanabaena sp. ELA645]